MVVKGSGIFLLAVLMTVAIARTQTSGMCDEPRPNVHLLRPSASHDGQAAGRIDAITGVDMWRLPVPLPIYPKMSDLAAESGKDPNGHITFLVSGHVAPKDADGFLTFYEGVFWNRTTVEYRLNGAAVRGGPPTAASLRTARDKITVKYDLPDRTTVEMELGRTSGAPPDRGVDQTLTSVIEIDSLRAVKL